jgi:hypothetical protein
MILERIRLQRVSDIPNSLDLTLEFGRHGTHQLTSIYQPVELELNDEQVQGLVDEVRRLNLPMTGLDGIVGCDGATYTLTITSGFQEARFKWWCEPPAGWEGLARIAAMLESFAPAPHGNGW